MEKNYISEYESTHFYVSLINKTYGVCININDLDNTDQIINHFKKDRMQQIESWKQDWEEGVA